MSRNKQKWILASLGYATWVILIIVILVGISSSDAPPSGGKKAESEHVALLSKELVEANDKGYKIGTLYAYELDYLSGTLTVEMKELVDIEKTDGIYNVIQDTIKYTVSDVSSLGVLGRTSPSDLTTTLYYLTHYMYKVDGEGIVIHKKLNSGQELE